MSTYIQILRKLGPLIVNKQLKAVYPKRSPIASYFKAGNLKISKSYVTIEGFTVKIPEKYCVDLYNYCKAEVRNESN